jgi:hypothetical protein
VHDLESSTNCDANVCRKFGGIFPSFHQYFIMYPIGFSVSNTADISASELIATDKRDIDGVIK